MAFPRVVLAVTLLSVVPRAAAWDNFGHMTVAAVAYKKLAPVARREVTRLLKLNPNYNQWITGVPSTDRDQVAFLRAATWPDAIKGMSTYTNDGEHPSGPDASRNIGYSDMLMHRYWHFIDIPFSPDGTPLVAPIAPNAQTQIHELRTTIGSTTASDELKSYDLAWLLHLVGDVHQPLHTTSRFDKEQPSGDAGGNLVALCAKPCRDELHAFWDDVLGTSSSATSASRLASRLRAPDPSLASITDEAKWIEESFEAAKTSVYVTPIGIGRGPFKMTQAYRSAARKVALRRVALSGARLARLLNDAFHS